MPQAKTTKSKSTKVHSTASVKTPPKTATQIKEDTDEFLDEIDRVLEDACEAMTFRQKGGQ